MAESQVSGGEVPELGEHFDALVVGAGIGGLACGALLAKAGSKVIVVERHKSPGGFVTSYDRKGYKFQVPHLIGGCGPGGDITRIADHLGLKVDFISLDPYQRFIYPEHDIKVPTDPEAFAEVLKEGFQPQTENINKFFHLLTKAYRAMDMSMVRRPMGPGTLVKLATYPFVHPKLLSMMIGGTTYEKLLDKHFTDDRLKTVLSTQWPYLGVPPWELSALSMLAMMASFFGGAYFPVGGYQVLTDAFAQALIDNGGVLLLGHEVTSINTEQGRVSEVEIIPRAKVETGVVVSNVDTRRTFMKLVDRENFTRAFLDRIDESPLSMTGFVIHLGMRKKVEDPDFACGSIFFQPSYDEREMVEAVSSRDAYPDPEKLRWGMSLPSLIDPTLAPEGCTNLDILVPAVPYQFMRRWGVEEGGKRGEKYRAIKEKYAEVVVDAVSRVFPDLISDVEAYDISTPITYERYTMAIDGCWYDTAPTGKVAFRRPGPSTSLKGLYLTGSKSVLGGGMYPSVMSGLVTADCVLRGKLSNLF